MVAWRVSDRRRGDDSLDLRGWGGVLAECFEESFGVGLICQVNGEL